MENDPGFKIVRFGDMAWEPRTEDEWPCLTKRHLFDPVRNLTCRFVWYARGAVEPRHVHGGNHAAFVMLGQAKVDGKVLGPWDVMYGPGNVPHGPLDYPCGCMLFVMLKGGALHTAVGPDTAAPATAGRPAGPVIESEQPWLSPKENADGWKCERKIMLDDSARDYRAMLVRWRKGSVEPRHVHAGTHAEMILSGRVKVDGVTLGPWDLMYGAGGVPHGPIEFLDDVTLAVDVAGAVAHQQVAG